MDALRWPAAWAQGRNGKRGRRRARKQATTKQQLDASNARAPTLLTTTTASAQVLDRNVENLSGGELQRFAIAVVACQQADVYMVDEPSSYLDVRQRLKAAQVRSGGVGGACAGEGGDLT